MNESSRLGVGQKEFHCYTSFCLCLWLTPDQVLLAEIKPMTLADIRQASQVLMWDICGHTGLLRLIRFLSPNTSGAGDHSDQHTHLAGVSSQSLPCLAQLCGHSC